MLIILLSVGAISAIPAIHPLTMTSIHPSAHNAESTGSGVGVRARTVQNVRNLRSDRRE